MSATEEIPMQLLVKRLIANARTPTRGSAYAAGYDLYSVEDTVVPARSQALISTGLAMTIPEGYYGRIAPRSGLAVKHGISVGAGVIDSDYGGCVKVLMMNNFNTDLDVSEGDRIAQLIIEKIATPDIELVENLDETVRGEGGFGSTGK